MIDFIILKTILVRLWILVVIFKVYFSFQIVIATAKRIERSIYKIDDNDSKVILPLSEQKIMMRVGRPVCTLTWGNKFPIFVNASHVLVFCAQYAEPSRLTFGSSTSHFPAGPKWQENQENGVSVEVFEDVGAVRHGASWMSKTPHIIVERWLTVT